MEFLTPEKHKKRAIAIKRLFLEAWPAESASEEPQLTEKQKGEIVQAIAFSDRTLRLVFTVKEIQSLIKILSPLASKSRSAAFIQEAEYLAHTTVMALNDDPRPISGPVKDAPNNLKLAHARATEGYLNRLLGREQRSREKHHAELVAHLKAFREVRTLLVRIAGNQYEELLPISRALEKFRADDGARAALPMNRVKNRFKPVVPFNFTDRQYGQDIEHLNSVAGGAAQTALESIDILIGAMAEAEARLPKGSARHRIHRDLSRTITGAYIRHIDQRPGYKKGEGLPDTLSVIYQAIGIELKAPTKAAKAAISSLDPS
jgi:hypothetical protein